MHKIFTIGDFCFDIEAPNGFYMPENFLKFEKKGNPEYHYLLNTVSELPHVEGEVIAEREDMRILKRNDLEIRYLGIKGKEDFYALYEETDEQHASVYFKNEYFAELDVDPFFSSLFALERRMITRDGLILHSAYLHLPDNQAILFSAPSGTGKSTQAGLWEKYRKCCYQVNGDRSLLQKVDHQWIARGWPVCGSSEICNVQDTPVVAIIMLSQDSSNHCERLTPMRAFSLVYPQITSNKWNKKAVLHTMDLIDDLIKNIPVYHLGCTISEEAVECLEKALKM